MNEHVRMREESVQRRQAAHKTLDRLMDEAEVGRAYGTVSVEVQFETGRITLIRRRMETSEK